MTPKVSIIMGSTSDLPVMEKAMKWLNDQQIPFEVNALSAHRTPDAVEEFAKNAKQRGVMDADVERRADHATENADDQSQHQPFQQCFEINGGAAQPCAQRL